MSKERRLTKREAIRKANYETIANRLEVEGYKKTEITVGVVLANILALFVMLPFIIIFLLFFIKLNPTLNSFTFRLVNVSTFLLWFIALVFAHELIHGITWSIFTDNHFKDIEFGIIGEALTPYCTCKCPLKKWQYLLGGAMPTLLLGFGLAIISIPLGSIFLFVLAEIMILSGGGDFLIIALILVNKNISKNVIYLDHPYKLGVCRFTL